MAVLLAVAMSKVTPLAGAGEERFTVNVKLVVPLFPSFCVTSLIVRQTGEFKTTGLPL